MIKALSNDLIILGLSKINIERLQEGHPISFNLSEIGLPDRPVLIFAGDNEKSMVQDLQAFNKGLREP